MAMLDLRPDHLVSAIEELASLGYGDAAFDYPVDVSDRAEMADTAQKILARFGSIDILVNNAGIGIQRKWDKVSYSDWDFGLQVNLGGVINGIMTYEPILRANPRGGYIVNTASLAGFATVPAAMAIYGTTKSAVVALTEALSPEFRAAGIGMSVLCPGLVRSNIAEIDRNRPPRFTESVADREITPEDAERDAAASWMDPEMVGAMVLDGIRNGQLYIITHPTHREKFEARTQAILEAWPAQ